ncbi:MAG TPA: AbrB/MazE/SpoVT family DNA-binding domain-containing protein [Candidatus Dojkabacteria bacterium]|nr:AbrB/MazE/SpoVT family DNA-binding domain-containing protein [Candidatus Dojkabacteria bacterium]
MLQVLTTITQKGQVTLPKKFRDKLGIKPYQRVKIEQAKGYLKISPTIDILQLAGKFKAPRGKSALKSRQELEKNYSID